MAAGSSPPQQQRKHQQETLNVSQNTLVVSSPLIITSLPSSMNNQSSVMSANSSSIMAAAAAEVAAQQQAHHHQQQQQAAQQQQHSISVQPHQVFVPAGFGLPQVYPPLTFVNNTIAFQNPYSANANGVSLHLQNAAANNKQHQIIAKSVQNHYLQQQLKNNSEKTAPMIRTATMLDPQQFAPNTQQFAPNTQQTLLIQPFQSSSQQQGNQSSLLSNIGKADGQKGKQYMMQTSGAAIQPKSQHQIQQQSIVNPQFKPSLQAATQSHHLIAAASTQSGISAQFLNALSPHINWPAGQPQLLLRNPNSTDLQQHMFIQSSTQNVPNISGTSIYMTPGAGPMHLVSTAPPAATSANMADLHTAMIPTSSSIQTSSSISTPSIVSATTVNTSHQSAHNQNKYHLNKNRLSSLSLSSSSIAIQTSANSFSLNESNSSRLSNNSTSSGHHHITSISTSHGTPARSLGPSQQQNSRPISDISSANQSQICKGLIQKSTQQMNAELLKAGANSPKVKQLVRSDSSRSLSSQSSAEIKIGKNGGVDHAKKLQEDQNNGGKKLDNRREISIENIDMNTRSGPNGLPKKSDKKNKLGLQKSSSKPSQVLTHCIDGHIIFESSVPFPVLSNLTRDTLRDRSNGPSTDQEAEERRCLQLFNNADCSSNENGNDLNGPVEYTTLPQQTMPVNNRESRKFKKKKAKLKASQAAKAAVGLVPSIEEKTTQSSSNIVNGNLSSNVGTFAVGNESPSCKLTTTTNQINIYTNNSVGINSVASVRVTNSPVASIKNQHIVNNNNHAVNVAKPLTSAATVSGESAMDLDSDNNFIQKQKLTSTPIEESTVIELSSNDSTVHSQQQSIVEKPVHQWTVEDVYDFVTKISSVEFARVLKEHFIDGRALMLLTVPIMKDELKLKLGPVLVLKAKIDELRDKFDAFNSDADFLPAEPNIYKWTVKDVYHFVLKLSSKEYAEEFEKQEMDGHALTLLSQEHIMKDMNMQFGPGLKILTKIKQLKESSEAP